MSLKAYKKKLDYTYAFGIHPTLELLKTKPKLVESILLSSLTETTSELNEIQKLAGENDIHCDIADKAIHKISVKENTQVVGVFKKFASGLDVHLNHIVLVNPSSPGNVGTIIRTMVGFNVLNLALIAPDIDIYAPMVIRASMGAFFYINFEQFESYVDYKAKYPENTDYSFVLNGKTNLSEVEFTQPASLIFGNEGRGLGKSFEEFENTIKINHSKKIESLNLSASVVLGLYELNKAIL